MQTSLGEITICEMGNADKIANRIGIVKKRFKNGNERFRLECMSGKWRSPTFKTVKDFKKFCEKEYRLTMDWI